MVKKYTPFFISAAVLYFVVAFLIVITLNKNNGILTYPLDDTFIHMAIAKNSAKYAVWGITKYEFSSTTSSPLYTGILAFSFFVFGFYSFIPLFLNILFAGLLLFVVNRLLVVYDVPPNAQIVTLLALVFFTPLPILVTAGMEHILHALLTIWFVHFAVRILVNNQYSTSDEVKLVVFAGFLVLSRYEGLFTVFPICCLLLFRKRFLLSIGVGFFALFPLILYGFMSWYYGSYWLPNSVLLKGQQIHPFTMAGIENLYSKPLHAFASASWLFTLSLFILVFYIKRFFTEKIVVWHSSQLMILVFFATLFFHVELAQVGWLYRYEAYLMAFGIFIVGVLWKDILFLLSFTNCYTKTAIGIFLMALLLPLLGRGFSAVRFGPKASHNIYLQQYQMGRFLKAYYDGGAVAANDIGAINYLAELKLVDIVGLGTIEIAKAKKEGRFTGKFVSQLAESKGVKIAIVYDRELQNSPTQWTKVGEWQIENNVVGASDVVAFYAVDPNEIPNLKRNLQEFKRKLPVGVTVKILE